MKLLEIVQAFSEGKKIIDTRNKNIYDSWEKLTSWYFLEEEINFNYEPLKIYAEPKTKTRYYQWRIKDLFGKWYRDSDYISEDGCATGEKNTFFGWSSLTKEKVNPETDFVEE